MTAMSEAAAAAFGDLVRIMRVLRAPGGCPWDREQTLQSLRPFVLEETYELLDTLDRGDLAGLREELGDFLYEAVFLAQIAEEGGHFSIADAVAGIAAKLVRRHPHVFTPDGQPLAAADALTTGEVRRRWEDLKADERKATGRAETSALDGVPATLPALLRAYELTARAAAVGFDWVRADDVLDKIDEEAREVRTAAGRGDAAALEDEIGDLLFAVANYARKLGVEPEAALRRAAAKFHGRFTRMEQLARVDGGALAGLSLDAQNALWDRVKAGEGHGPAAAPPATDASGR
ncbi:MAG: nucleoside triphosphate pyrophosphohydrolase [Vicinamibacterales bacterium]